MKSLETNRSINTALVYAALGPPCVQKGAMYFPDRSYPARKLFMAGVRSVSYTHLDVYKRQAAWTVSRTTSFRFRPGTACRLLPYRRNRAENSREDVEKWLKQIGIIE